MLGTFCDLIVSKKESYFHEDTVIFECSSLIKAKYLVGKDIRKIGKPSMPVYPYVFVEGLASNTKMRFGVYLFKTDLQDIQDSSEMIKRGIHKNVSKIFNKYPYIYTANLFAQDLKSGNLIYTLPSALLAFDEGGVFSDCIEISGGYIHSDSSPAMAMAVQLPIMTGVVIHEKHDIELCDYCQRDLQKYRRRYKKEPSPYFRIIAPETPQKRYNSNGVGTGNKIKLPLHTVRGHFRHVENHPLPQFNGTFWIPAHTRGDEKLGKLQKHYKIRLPDKSA